MTNEEFEEKVDGILNEVPVEFHSVMRAMAYDRGHSGGQSEVLNILDSIVYDFAPVIELFRRSLLTLPENKS